VTITTTLTWADLRAAYADELADLKDAYHEVAGVAADEYDAGLETVAPDDDRLQALKANARQFEQAVEEIQKNRHVLEQLEAEYGDGAFEIKMLSGDEVLENDTELKLQADRRGVPVETLQHKRNALVVDAATVDAPDGVPTDDSGSPVPSDAPNPLTFALWEQVEQLNDAGETDFTPAGVSDGGDIQPAATSATPTPTDSGADSSTNGDPTTPE